MKIAFTQFLGANSDVSDELLQPNYAVEATNVFTDQGALSTWKGLKEVSISPVWNSPVWNSTTGTLSSLFLMDNARWLAFASQADCALLQMAKNTDWQVAFTNATEGPQYTSKSIAIGGGGTTYPVVFYNLGIAPPTDALVASVTAKITPANSKKISWSIAGTVSDAIGNRVARSYVYTFVNSWGREGPPSSPSNLVYTNDDEHVTLTGFHAAPEADLTKIRIYVASAGGTYNFLIEKAALGDSYLVTNNAFGAAITTTLYSPPPVGLLGLVSMANGMLAGYVGNDVYFSEPYQSHAWPEDYIKSMDYPIKGLAAIGNMLYISTNGYPVIGTGNSPAFMSFSKLGAIPANYSSRSMVTMGVGFNSTSTMMNMGMSIMYASRDGIVLLTAGSAMMASDGIISERVYQQMNPSSIHAYFYRNKYVGFYDSGLTGSITADTGEIIPAKGGFILDPMRKTVTYTDVYCQVAFSDKESGKLYLAINTEIIITASISGTTLTITSGSVSLSVGMAILSNTNVKLGVVASGSGTSYTLTNPVTSSSQSMRANINKLYEWNEGSTNLTQAWKTKPVQTEPINFSVARVWAKRYPITFQLYGDDALVHTQTVTSQEPFRLPSGYRSRKWAARITGDSYINGIFLATSVQELMQ